MEEIFWDKGNGWHNIFEFSSSDPFTNNKIPKFDFRITWPSYIAICYTNDISFRVAVTMYPDAGDTFTEKHFKFS